ncbi:MAG: class I SAM-dependent RNA methyltransferase [Paracoccus sp. (in: a-proteobacteria)]|uniref:class I SAM-dependent RNA methyltransferase n=1 Tax=Paracoccus sp. TaxID=267 RepID=UPI0039E28EB1
MTEWTVARLGRKGDGVAISGERRALAPLTLPGEVIQGEAEAGRIAAPRVLTPSAQRVRAPCPHYRACGGCTLMHGSEDFVKGWKVGVVTEALRAQGLAAPIAGVHVSPPRSRRRAVLSGRRTKKGALLGYHARASDVVVDLADCQVLRPAILAALPLLREMVVAGASRAGELAITVVDSGAGLDVTVTGGKPLEPGLFQALAGLAEKGDLARLTWDGQSLTRRPPALAFGRARVVPPAGGFLQATAEGEAALVAAVREFTQGTARILELFAGCGTFTLPLAETAELHAVEGLAAPLAALEAGARQAPGLRRITTEIRDLARRPLLRDELAYDAIVIDPPRSGAEAQAREIAASRVRRLAWISCDPVTFARDARILAEADWEISRLYVVDQFRWSPHVETVAEIRRR